MDFTSSNAHVVHAGTGRRMHQDSAPVPTELSAADINQIIWGLMQLLIDAGISPAAFDPAVPATYNRISLAVQALGGVPLSAFTGANQSLTTAGFQRLPGGLILQWASVAFASPPAGDPGTTGTTLFPVAFPSACLHAFLSTSVTPGSAGNHHAAVTAVSASAVTWDVQESYDSDNPGVLHILAIGF